MKSLITCAIVVVLVVAGFVYIKSIDSKKTKIMVSEQKDAEVVAKQPAMDSQTAPEETAPAEDDPAPVKAPEKANPVLPKTETKNSSVKIIDRLMSSGFKKSSGRSIDTIIIHSSYDAIGSNPFSISGIIKEYEEYGVSAHYLIGRDGDAYRLVEDKNIAYHAGVAKTPDGRTNVNDFSIGIEIINTKTDKITDAQYASLNDLIAQLRSEYKIKYVLGHDQIAPGRKDDPWNFDWKRLK